MRKKSRRNFTKKKPTTLQSRRLISDFFIYLREHPEMMSDFFCSFLTPFPPNVPFLPSNVRFFGVILGPLPHPQNWTSLMDVP